MPENDTTKQDFPNTGRRSFLKVAVGFLAALNGLVLGVPFMKTLLSVLRAGEAPWVEVANIGSLPEGRPVDIKFETREQDAFYRNTVLHTVWVIKKPDGDVSVLSPVCPHLGCYFKWNGSTGHFECPCHASVFAKDGEVLSGPAPRSLDTLPHKTEAGRLYVRWVRYRPGAAEKIAV